MNFSEIGSWMGKINSEHGISDSSARDSRMFLRQTNRTSLALQPDGCIFYSGICHCPNRHVPSLTVIRLAFWSYQNITSFATQIRDIINLQGSTTGRGFVSNLQHSKSTYIRQLIKRVARTIQVNSRKLILKNFFTLITIICIIMFACASDRWCMSVRRQ